MNGKNDSTSVLLPHYSGKWKWSQCSSLGTRLRAWTEQCWEVEREGIGHPMGTEGKEGWTDACVEAGACVYMHFHVQGGRQLWKRAEPRRRSRQSAGRACAQKSAGKAPRGSARSVARWGLWGPWAVAKLLSWTLYALIFAWLTWLKSSGLEGEGEISAYGIPETFINLVCEVGRHTLRSSDSAKG